MVVNNNKDQDKQVKYSLKGVNNHYIDPSAMYEHVLNIKKPILSTNIGIRCFTNNTVCTYTQTKQAFNYFYCKRVVLEDGIHTVPLDIVLTPITNIETHKKIKRKTINFLMILSGFKLKRHIAFILCI